VVAVVELAAPLAPRRDPRAPFLRGEGDRDPVFPRGDTVAVRAGDGEGTILGIQLRHVRFVIGDRLAGCVLDFHPHEGEADRLTFRRGVGGSSLEELPRHPDLVGRPATGQGQGRQDEGRKEGDPASGMRRVHHVPDQYWSALRTVPSSTTRIAYQIRLAIESL